MPKTVKITEPTWRKIATLINDSSPNRTARDEKITGSNIIRVRNNTGSAVNRFGVLKITNSLISPQSNLLAFHQSTVLDGGVPDETSPFVITDAAAYNGAIVAAYASGVCPVKINVADASHQYATAKSGDATQLQSAESGVCSILWKESGTGTKWAVVRFGGSGGGGGGTPVIWAKVSQIPAYNDPTKNKFIVQRASVDTDPQSQTYNQWIGDGVPIDIERALGFEGYLDGGDNAALDIRNWAPWPGVGAIVPIIQRWDAQQETPAMRWYIDIPMVFGGDESISSIRQNPVYWDGAMHQNITQVVWV